MTNRDELRSGIFNSKARKPQTKPLDFFGQTIEIRQPTIGQLTKLAEQARSGSSTGIVNILIEYSYVPGTNEKVFEEADKDSLLDLPTGKWLEELNKILEEFSGIDVKAAEKNSGETTSDMAS